MTRSLDKSQRAGNQQKMVYFGHQVGQDYRNLHSTIMILLLIGYRADRLDGK